MTRSGPQNMDDIENRRVELEENVAKLRKSLQHWQESEIEYGDFKEQLEALQAEPTQPAMIEIGKSLKPSFITEKELEQLVGPKRTRQQVIGMISRRIDYVQHNAQSLQKQLDARERELDDLKQAEELVGVDDSLPIMEIMEVLDDDGNVVSSSMSTADDAGPKVIDVLKKAGMMDSDLGTNDSKRTRSETDDAESTTTAKSTSSQDHVKRSSKDTVEPAREKGNSTKRTKSVSFAEDVSVSPSPAHRSASPPPSALPPTPVKTKFKGSWEVEEAKRGRFHEGNRVIELNDMDQEIGSLPVVTPDDESPEDAQLRREMNQYALNEVGAIVAEMNIEEGGDLDDEDMYDEDDEDNTDDENEYGMTTQDLISEDDRSAMLDLEKKLKARMMHNAGPNPDVAGLTVDTGELQESTVSRGYASIDEPTRKGVHFASEVEVAPSPVDQKPAASTEPQEHPPDPMSDLVIERSSTTSATPPSSNPRSKVSRFKKSLANTDSKQERQPPNMHPSIPMHLRDDPEQSAMHETPEGPPGETLSTTVLERAPKGMPAPPDETGLDPALLQQELAVENRRLLNERVHKQGGFKPTAEDEDNPIVEERHGKVQKVSRFKAAKLKDAGM